MFQVGPAERLEFSHLLQSAYDQATSATADTPTITVDDMVLLCSASRSRSRSASWRAQEVILAFAALSRFRPVRVAATENDRSLSMSA
ncbi:MAG TPA: hypothetical protein DCF81_14195 [Erythrobacter sp.]|nr:hypothetical protein [Erythrobacter sp.]